ncbi:MAG: glycine cleavage system protein GcvH [Candidatus Polarisedimenticolaceae bacterium]|nr:glycine cleavage system protein GcvH [Candidatus Polarisedimenticolaceae bacterium]
MSETPAELKYSKEHEWIREEGNDVVVIGITDHAQEQLGDLVFVELPEMGSALESGAECAVVESVKAASDIYMPLSGEVVAVNETLADTPENINDAPYGDGWIFKIKLSDSSELESLMDADAYNAFVADDS